MIRIHQIYQIQLNIIIDTNHSMKKCILLVLIVLANSYYYAGKTLFETYLATFAYIQILEVSSDGKYIAVEENNKITRFYGWDGTNYASINNFTHTGYTSYGTSFCSNGSYAITSLGNKTVKLYKLNVGVYSQIHQLTYIPNKNYWKMTSDASKVYTYVHEAGNYRFEIYNNDGTSLTISNTLALSNLVTGPFEISSDGSILIYNSLNIINIITLSTSITILNSQQIVTNQSAAVFSFYYDKYLGININSSYNLYKKADNGTFYSQKNLFLPLIRYLFPFQDESGFLVYRREQYSSVLYYQAQVYQFRNNGILKTQNFLQANQYGYMQLADNSNLLIISSPSSSYFYVYFNCGSYCYDCSSKLNCTKCFQGFTLNSNGTCQCSELDYSINTQTGFCIKCAVNNCLQCNQTDKCVQCKNPYFLSNNTCLNLNENNSSLSNSQNFNLQTVILGFLALVTLLSIYCFITVIVIFLLLIYLLFQMKVQKPLHPVMSGNDLKEHKDINITRQNLNVQEIDIQQLQNNISKDEPLKQLQIKKQIIDWQKQLQ